MSEWQGLNVSGCNPIRSLGLLFFFTWVEIFYFFYPFRRHDTMLKGRDETRSPGRSLNLNYLKKGNPLLADSSDESPHQEWYNSGATTTPQFIQGPLPMHVANIRAPRVTKRCMIYVTGSSGSGKSIQGPGFLQLVHEGEQSRARRRLSSDWNRLM